MPAFCFPLTVRQLWVSFKTDATQSFSNRGLIGLRFRPKQKTFEREMHCVSDPPKTAKEPLLH